MTSLYKGGNCKDACRYPRCQVRCVLHITGAEICLFFISNVNIDSLCSTKICESICHETFHAVYYFFTTFGFGKKNSPYFPFHNVGRSAAKCFPHWIAFFPQLPQLWYRNFHENAK